MGAAIVLPIHITNGVQARQWLSSPSIPLAVIRLDSRPESASRCCPLPCKIDSQADMRYARSCMAHGQWLSSLGDTRAAGGFFPAEAMAKHGATALSFSRGECTRPTMRHRGERKKENRGQSHTCCAWTPGSMNAQTRGTIFPLFQTTTTMVRGRYPSTTGRRDPPSMGREGRGGGGGVIEQSGTWGSPKPEPASVGRRPPPPPPCLSLLLLR
jgi:hypothetical protein